MVTFSLHLTGVGADKSERKPMKKLIIEIEDDLKIKFDVACAKLGKNKKEIIIKLINKWLKI